nr:unnamed protein product [Callosobruchus chinensis]
MQSREGQFDLSLTRP